MLRTLLRSHLEEGSRREHVNGASLGAMHTARASAAAVPRVSRLHRPVRHGPPPPPYTRSSLKTEVPVKCSTPCVVRRRRSRKPLRPHHRQPYAPTAPSIPHHHDVVRPAYPRPTFDNSRPCRQDRFRQPQVLVVHGKRFYPKPPPPFHASLGSWSEDVRLPPRGHPSSCPPNDRLLQSASYHVLVPEETHNVSAVPGGSSSRYPHLQQELHWTRLLEQYRRFRVEQQQAHGREAYDPEHPYYDRPRPVVVSQSVLAKAYDPEQPGYFT
jgi:hypothetical protein